MILNIMINAVLKVVLEDVCRPQEDRHGMGWASGERNIIFYANDGRITVRESKWVKEALTTMVAMLCRVGLTKNIKNTKAMVCGDSLVKSHTNGGWRGRGRRSGGSGKEPE